MILLIIAVSVDAMSFGFSQGIKKLKLNFFIIISMSLLSTLLFAIPLNLSNILIYYLNEKILNIVNGLFLIVLGLYYLYTFIKNSKKIKIEEIPKFKIKNFLSTTFIISLDASFTGLLNGYLFSYINLIIGVIIYFFITFLSLTITHIIGLNISKNSNIDLCFISSIIFIILGLLKFFGI